MTTLERLRRMLELGTRGAFQQKAKSMTVFRLKSAAYFEFLNCTAGIIKVSDSVKLDAGEEVKIVNAEQPGDPPVFAKIRGKHYERSQGKLIACYVVE